MWNKLKIHPTCYAFLLLCIVTGDFIRIDICSLLLIIHELGHFLTAVILHYPTDNITFYPFGGIAKFKADLNSPLKKELLILLMGPITQCLGFYLLKHLSFFASYQQLLTMIHYQILCFNLLPVYPLDGSRILQCLLCYFIPYAQSFTIIYAISYLILLLILLLFSLYFQISYFLLFFLLLTRLLLERKKIKYYQEKFLLERYLHTYHFPKHQIVTSEKEFKRDYRHTIHFPQYDLTEKQYLQKKYQQKKN